MDLFSANVKEHATLSAGAGVDHGVDDGITKDHVNRAADRGCCVSTCSDYFFLKRDPVRVYSAQVGAESIKFSRPITGMMSPAGRSR